MPPRFDEWFCLESGRTFAVKPDRDPEFYFGRSELAKDITTRIDRSVLLQSVPKLVLFGAYGAGKTHTLYHIKWFLENHESHKFEVRYVETPIDLHKKSKYHELHQAMMDRLGPTTVRRLLEKLITKHLGDELQDFLLEYFNHDEDLVSVIRMLATSAPQHMTAWKWLRGEALSESQQQNIGVARSPDLKDLIEVLLTIGRLFQDEEETTLVFLIDELEQLEYVTGEEIGTWETAFRRLADQDNRSVGLVFAARGAGPDNLPEPLRIEAVTSRLQLENYVEIPYLHDVDDYESFLKDLLTHLVERPCAEARLEEEGIDIPLELYPFTPEAVDLIYQFISEDPTRQLPRELIFTLNECGAAAVGRSAVITEDIAQEVLF